MKKLLSLLLAAVLLLSLALPLAACAADYSDLPLFYITTEDRLSTKLHSSMSTTENNVVKYLTYGTIVHLIRQESEDWCQIWLRVQDREYMGYVQTEYLTFDEPQGEPLDGDGAYTEPVPPTADFTGFAQVQPYYAIARPTMADGVVAMRWAPSLTMPVQEHLTAGAEIVVLAKNRYWAQVIHPSTGMIGYISTSYMTEMDIPAEISVTGK